MKEKAGEKEMERVNIGVIGLGQRGKALLGTILALDDARVGAVCDGYADRREYACKKVEDSCGQKPAVYDDYHALLNDPSLDAVLITAGWEEHIRMAIESMSAGKITAMEVGGAYSVEECWELVRTHEETGMPCMMLENCCYGRDELMVLNMVKQGLFGDIVHCQGGYRHDLRDEVSYGRENRHYRLVNYINRNCENYPSHELGPIA